MSRAFFTAIENLMRTLTYMSFAARPGNREEWEGPPESDRERCVQALESLRAVWNQPPQELARLDELVTRCLHLYADGELDAGDYAVRDIDEFLSGVRDRAAASKAKPR